MSTEEKFTAGVESGDKICLRLWTGSILGTETYPLDPKNNDVRVIFPHIDPKLSGGLNEWKGNLKDMKLVKLLGQGKQSWVFDVKIETLDNVALKIASCPTKEKCREKVEWALEFSRFQFGPKVYKSQYGLDMVKTKTGEADIVRPMWLVLREEYTGHLDYSDAIIPDRVYWDGAKRLEMIMVTFSFRNKLIHGKMKPEKLLVTRLMPDHIVKIVLSDHSCFRLKDSDSKEKIALVVKRYQKYCRVYPHLERMSRTFGWTPELISRHPQWFDHWLLILICVLNNYLDLLLIVKKYADVGGDKIFGGWDCSDAREKQLAIFSRDRRSNLTDQVFLVD